MALLGFIGFLSMSSQRMCVSVALVCMLNQTSMTPTAADGDQALTVGPTPTAAVVTAAATPLNVSAVDEAARDNATVAGGRVETPSPVKACGEIPEIFVLNTSYFSRINVSPMHFETRVFNETAKLYNMDVIPGGISPSIIFPTR